MNLFHVTIHKWSFDWQNPYDGSLLNTIVEADDTEQIIKAMGFRPGQLDIDISLVKPKSLSELSNEAEEVKDRYL